MTDTIELDKLPVEVIYRILDCLDIQTIFYSLYGVCRRINYTLGTYNRYKFNFKSISKHDFHLICRLLPHKQVVALTLSDQNDTPDQIQLFLSLFNIKEFVRLSSLTLHKIREIDLQKILEKTSLKSLKYLSIDCQTEYQAKTLDLLRSSLRGHSLQTLSLGSASLCLILTAHNMANIRHLVLNGCMIRQVEKILSLSPSLETFDLTNVRITQNEDLKTVDSSPNSPKLVSLTISSSLLTMDRIVNFFNWLFPNSKQLRHLRVINNADDEDYFDGSRWESLLSTTSLIQFEFCFHANLTMNEPISDILLSFRSQFWLKEKYWFVACDQHRLLNKSVLYSIPWCDIQVIWQPLMDFESENTLPDNECSVFNRVNHLHIKLNCQVLKAYPLHSHHFPRVSSLKIKSTLFLSTPFIRELISSLKVIFSQLVSLVLSIHIDQTTLSNIFRQTPLLRDFTTRQYPVLNHMKLINNREMMNQIRSLDLHEELHLKKDVLWLVEAFPHVAHLHVNVSNVRHMRTISDRLQFSLTTLHFRCSSIARAEVRLEKVKVAFLNWLHGQQWHFTFYSEEESILFWLSNRQMKGWWEKKRRFSLSLKDEKSKRMKSINTTMNTNDQDD